MSPVADNGYHTRLFSLAAPKLNRLTRRSVRQFFFEAYGPGGGAMMVECATEDRAFITQLRQIVSRHGGAPGAPGSVSYLFNPTGLLVFDGDVRKAALTAGAEDVVAKPADGTTVVLTDPIELESVRTALVAKGFVPRRVELTRYASTSVVVRGAAAVAMRQLLEALKGLNYVKNVYTNVEISDEVLAGI